MAMNGFARNFKSLEILREEQVEQIHSGTLQVLESTGVKFESKRALRLLEDAGCRVDGSERRVRFPPSLVEQCLRKCPSSFAVKARDPKNSLRFGGNTLYFYNSCGLSTIDLDTWEPRTPTMLDQNDGIKVLDALDNLHLINTYTPYMEIEGVPACMLLLESLASRLRNTTKVTMIGYLNESERFTISMAKEAGAQCLGLVTVGPPLTYYEDACEAVFRFVEAGFPIFLSGGVTYGGTGPATIAGSTIVNNAELMAGIVLVQLINPGTSVLVTDFTFPMDMRTGSPAFGALGSVLHLAAFAQIWKGYGIPTCESISGYSSSKKMDFQCGYEKATAALTAALSGFNMVSMHGGVTAELSYHPVQSVLDDDIAGMVGRFVEGFEVSGDTLALDLIEQVGPSPGHYVDKEHTLIWWKKEHFIPRVADWLPYPEWIERGKKGTLDYAKERVKEILAHHHVSVPLTPSQEGDIERILTEARGYYRGKGLISEEESRRYEKIR